MPCYGILLIVFPTSMPCYGSLLIVFPISMLCYGILLIVFSILMPCYCSSSASSSRCQVSYYMSTISIFFIIFFVCVDSFLIIFLPFLFFIIFFLCVWLFLVLFLPFLFFYHLFYMRLVFSLWYFWLRCRVVWHSR